MKHLLVALMLITSTGVNADHNHGEGKLTISINDKVISMTLDLPMEATVGFERAPRTDNEKAALTHAEKTLSDAELFSTTPAAQCRAESVTVTMPGLDGHGHADIEARYVYKCAHPGALKEISTRIFAHFKRLYRIDIERTGPKGPGVSRLTPKKPVIIFP